MHTTPEGQISLLDFKKEKIELLNNVNLSNDELFIIKTANQWMDEAKERPIPKKLFSILWFESELCILFSDTNLGKSILAVQIADAISNGKSVLGFPSEVGPQKVMYFDFELSDKQFETRYSYDYEDHYRFNNNFLRIEINTDFCQDENLKDFENSFIDRFEKSIVKTKAKIVIVDNITYLKSENEKAKDALSLMKQLKRLKKKYGLSILALAHTPKRDLYKPISKNDLQGSKMLINFCDSSFTIGESQQDKQLRYLKQIKARNTEIKYDSDNICLCQINKSYNFLQFEFADYDIESKHLKIISAEDKSVLEDNIIELKESNPELSYGHIANQLGTNKMKVKRVLDKNKS